MADAHRFDDLFQAFGPIRLRRFFGGEGIYAGDIMIGAVFDDHIFFKTDARTRVLYLAENCKPFSFFKQSKGEMVVTTWYAVPERLYDAPEEFSDWARAALGVATTPAPAKRIRQQTRPPRKRSERMP